MNQKQWFVVAGALAMAAFVIGLFPVSASGVSCGSAWVSSDAAAAADYGAAMRADAAGIGLGGDLGSASAACDSAVQSWRIVSILVVALAAAAASVGVAGNRVTLAEAEELSG